MLIDIVNPGWAPVFQSNLTEDIPGYLDAPDQALAYQWKHFIGGHLGRLGTRDDIAFTTFQVLQSIRLDVGYGSWVHP